MDFSDDFVVDDPFIFGYFLEERFAANIFRFGSHARIFFVSLSLVCLNYLYMTVDFTKFDVLEFFLDRHNSPFL